jgi:hypothetical protein
MHLNPVRIQDHHQIDVPNVIGGQTFLTSFPHYIAKAGHPVPELNFVLDENKGNLQAAQNSFLFMVVIKFI